MDALILDLDETLLDGSGLRSAIMRTCEIIACQRSELEITRLIEANGRVWQRYWPEVEDSWTLGAIAGAAVSLEGWRRTLEACGCNDESTAQLALETHLGLARENHRLFDDVEELFAVAQTVSVPLALITNGASDTQRDKLDVLGIERHFAMVVISAEVGVAKPDAKIFELVLDELGVRNENVWHVGDSVEADVRGAKAAGVGAVWLNRNSVSRRAHEPEPDLEITSLSSLLPYLE